MKFNPEQPKQLKRFEGKAGTEYRLIILAYPHFEELEQKVGDLLKDHFKDTQQKEISVLEIGTGPGYTTEIISLADQRIQVTTIDNEEIMVKQANQLLEQLVTDGKVRIERADALEYLKKLDSESFDAFASGFTLHNFDHTYRSTLLNEIYRILKKDGLFINADKYAHDDPEQHETALQWQLSKFNKVYTDINRPDLTTIWTAHYAEDEKPNVIMREQESANEMKAVGFNKVQNVYRQQMEAIITATK